MRSDVRLRVLITPCAAALMVGFALPASPAVAAAHSIRPGSVVTVADMQCKVGLLLHKGKTVYAAIPASCTALPFEEGKPQDGCSAAAAPIGTPAKVAGARHRAVLVYDSFTRMESLGTANSNRCHYNDLALLRLRPSDAKHADGTIPGRRAPRRVSRHAPPNGSAVSVGASSAVAGAPTHGGWVYPLTGTPTLTASDIGTPVVQGGRLLGMLTAVPQGTVMKTDAAAYNLHRAITLLHKVRGFHNVKLVRAGNGLSAARSGRAIRCPAAAPPGRH